MAIAMTRQITVPMKSLARIRRFGIFSLASLIGSAPLVVGRQFVY